ncbi:tail fiber protein [Achromobacter phage kwar_LB4]|nr:tail fiber protein [Achromobacter phage kwar_LB4]
MGKSSDQADIIMAYLDGKITETQLAQSLIEKIDSGGGAAVEVEAIQNALAAMYTIKTQLTAGGRTALAGIGVGVENNAGVLESQVLVLADRFAVGRSDDATGTFKSMFIIDNGNVYIDTAFIKNGTITNLMIGDIYCWLFQSAAEGGHPAVSGIPGLRVRNESTGQIVWQHNLRALRVVDAVYNAQGGWSKAYPAGRVYRLAPLSWGGLSEIRDVGDAGMGDGSRLYQQYWRTCYWNINNNVVSIRQVQESDQEIFDGPAGLACIVGMTPHLSFLVVDMTNFP